MTDIRAWLDQVSARLEAVKKEPAQEDRDHEVESQAWSDLYEHTPTDLTKALAALQAVLDVHHGIPDYGWCRECIDRIFVHGECPTVRAIQDALGEDQP